jgi:hypothetical protein
MPLIYRNSLSRALTWEEGDGNYAWLATNLSGSNIIMSGSINATGSVTITGSLSVSGSLSTMTFVSGARLTVTSSGVPTWSGSDGQYIFGSGSGGYKMFVYLGGAWRSGSLL